MKITKVSCWREDLELKKPYRIAYRTIEAVENVFVKIQLADGTWGIGAASPSEHVTGESIEQTERVLREKAEGLLTGVDIKNFQRILSTLTREFPQYPAARAAVDIALHDAFSKWMGIPLVDFLGQVHPGLPTSVTIGIVSVDETINEARTHLDNGFEIIKLKIGKGVREDIRTLQRLRKFVGPSVIIRIDANQAYSAKQLERYAEEASRFDVELYEQPLPAGHTDEMKKLSEDLRSKCAADEDLLDGRDAQKLACPPHPFGVFNIKLMKCGGIGEAMHIARVAERAGISLMWGCNDESAVSISAALHAALACRATRYLDLDGSFDLASDIVEGGFLLEKGIMKTTGQPGLGVDLK